MLVGGSIWAAQAMEGNATETRYVLAAAKTGTLVTSVSGTGQVEGEAEIDVNPEVSGTILEIAAWNGQRVAEGDVLAVLDSADAAKSVRDARLSLASAQLSLQKLEQSADALSMLQAQNALAQAERTLADLEDGPDAKERQDAENAVAQAQRNLEQAQRNLEETSLGADQDLSSASEEGYNSVTQAFTELSSVMADLSDIMGTESDEREYVGYYDLLAGSLYTDSLVENYDAAEDSYDAAWNAYRVSDHDSDTDAKVETIDLTLVACKDISNALNDAQTLLNKIQEEGYANSAIRDHIDDLIALVPADIATMNGYISSLQSAADTIKQTDVSAPYSVADAEDAVENAMLALTVAEDDLADLLDGAEADDVADARENVEEKRQQLADLEAGTDALELKSQRLSVQERQNSLNDALEEYAKYVVRAPISGTVASVGVYRGQSASSGTSIATIVADQLVASIALNEVDVASVDVGDKVTATFDAIEDLALTGSVAEIDSIGTVSSGVVSYGVLVRFDMQDERVRSGMSVSAVVATDVLQNAVIVPSSAVKAAGGTSYVEVLDGVDASAVSAQGVTSDTAPRRVAVEVGMSNDTETEIISGLTDGEYVVTRTIAGSEASTTKATSSSSSAASLLGGTGTGGPPGEMPH